MLDDSAVLTELVRLRDTGVKIGLTVTGPRQSDTIRHALDVRVDGVGLFQTVQATWNVLEPSAGAALADAKAAGWGVIVKEVLANGRLTARHAGPELRELCAFASSYGAALEELAVSAALAQPWADVVLSGAVTCDQLYGCLAALDGSIDTVPELPCVMPPDLYWRQRERVAWN